MLLEDVMHVLPLLVPQAFVDQFVFIWGCENALGPWVNSLQEHIIILRIQIMCTLHVEGYTMG
jgi:hypothetical protein